MIVRERKGNWSARTPRRLPTWFHSCLGKEANKGKGGFTSTLRVSELDLTADVKVETRTKRNQEGEGKEGCASGSTR